jgi:hypothetical protein
MDRYATRRASGIALGLGLGILCAGPVPGASAQQRQQEVAPCRVQRGDRHVREDRSAALGDMALWSCARTIRAGSGTGTWGPYDVEVEADGRVRLNGEEVGVLPEAADDDPARWGGPGRG